MGPDEIHPKILKYLTWKKMIPYNWKTAIVIHKQSLIHLKRGAWSVMVIVIGNGHSNQSSNPGWRCLHFTNTLGKGMNPTILPSIMGK